MTNKIVANIVEIVEKKIYFGEITFSDGIIQTVKKIGDEWFVVSNRAIKKGEEITSDYNDTPDFIAKPDSNWTC